jgi:hypothetical protein
MTRERASGLVFGLRIDFTKLRLTPAFGSISFRRRIDFTKLRLSPAFGSMRWHTIG